MKHENDIAKILILSILNGNKQFWHYIKCHKKDQPGISSLQTTSEVATIPTKKGKFYKMHFSQYSQLMT